MLEVGAQTLSLEGSPEEVLLDGVGLLSPGGEAVGVDGELGLEALLDGDVGEEEDGSGGALEAGDTVGGGLPGLRGNDGLEGVRGDVPELVVLGAEEDDEAVGLGVEGRGGLEGGLLDNLLDALGSHGEVLGEGVVGAAVLSQLEDEVGGELGGHCEGWFAVLELKV